MAPSHEFHSDPSVRTIIKKKARQLCRRSECSRSDFDDLCQEMHLHLLRKAHLFDPARACPMAFAQQAINSYAAMHLRAACWFFRSIPLSLPQLWKFCHFFCIKKNAICTSICGLCGLC